MFQCLGDGACYIDQDLILHLNDRAQLVLCSRSRRRQGRGPGVRGEVRAAWTALGTLRQTVAVVTRQGETSLQQTVKQNSPDHMIV